MARSVKKGPFVQDSLMTKVQVLNGENEKRVVKTWSRASTICPKSWDTPSRCTTGTRMALRGGGTDASLTVPVPVNAANFGLGRVRIVAPFEGVNAPNGSFLVNDIIATKH